MDLTKRDTRRPFVIGLTPKPFAGRQRMNDKADMSDGAIAQRLRTAFALSAAIDDQSLLESVRSIRAAVSETERWRAVLASDLGLALSLKEPFLDDAIEDVLSAIPTSGCGEI